MDVRQFTLHSIDVGIRPIKLSVLVILPMYKFDSLKNSKYNFDPNEFFEKH